MSTPHISAEMGDFAKTVLMPDLEVTVVAAGTSGAAHIADELTLLDRLTGVHHQRQAVGVQGGIAAVSYTHLDVYKRQGSRYGCFARRTWGRCRSGR